MDETILLPSPNWFLVSNIAVGTDGWVIYGGPSKSLCVLEPLKPDFGIVQGNDRYHAHVVMRSHYEKIVSVDMSPEWPEKRAFLTGSSDGVIKQWILETIRNKIKIKATHSHEVHHHDKEEIAGVGYSTETYAITVGCFGNVVRWDLTSNVAKTFSYLIKNFRPTCMACSQHVPLNVAVGTKQGVVLVLDLNHNGKVLYKVRGQDDEVMNVSWCPKYETSVKKTLKESEQRSHLKNRIAAIQNEGEMKINVLEQSGVKKDLPEDSFDESIVQEDDMFDIYTDHEADEFGHKKYVPEDIIVKVKQEKTEENDYLAECLKLKEEILRRKNQTIPTIESLVQALDDTHVEGAKPSTQTKTENTSSAIAQSEPDSDLPSIAQIESESTSTEIAQSESKTTTIEVAQSESEDAQLLPQGDQTGAKVIDSAPSTSNARCGKTNQTMAGAIVETSPHTHKHLLATIGKYGGVRIWSKSGKLVASCAVPYIAKTHAKSRGANWPTLLWYRPNSLLIVDGKSQLLECNPLQIDCKNKLEYRIVHTLHKRGMYCIASDAPRVLESYTSDSWSVWSFSQDRNIIRYCMKTRKPLGVHNTCGGFLYTILPCSYDAGKVAVGVGDGAVRVWECREDEADSMRLVQGHVKSFWQNVQGKVLSLAWHPQKEHLLAYATAEARVGLLDTSGAGEKPGRVLLTALSEGVYSVCWGIGMKLYACAGGSLVMYNAKHTDQAPEPIEVELEGQRWGIYAASWSPRGLLVGSFIGAVAVLTSRPPHTLIAATFVFNKMIHAMEWHPQQTSSSIGESPYKDLIAVSALDKENLLVILEYGTKEDGTVQLTIWKKLAGHKSPVLQVAWNPHRDEQLLSTSQDASVRVWDIVSGCCISIFGGHSQCSIGASWLSHPQLPNYIMSGGSDACLRLWDINKHKPEDYDVPKHEVISKKKDKERKGTAEPPADTSENTVTEVKDEDQVAKSCELGYLKMSKMPRKFLLPVMYKQVNDPCRLPAPIKMLQMYVEKTERAEKGDSSANLVEKGNTDSKIDEKGDGNTEEKVDVNVESEENGVSENGDVKVAKDKIQLDFLKVFGSIKDVNEFLDLEMAHHLAIGQYEAWIMLSIFRGQIDTMIQFASQRNMLCPYLLSITPCVSFKYWKDATQLYLAQIDRLVAKGEEDKLSINRYYGGSIYRKAATLLSIHDVKGALSVLLEAKLFKEAYILCRIRYMDSVAEETLKQWAENLAFSGRLTTSAVCYIAMGNLSQAAQVLARSNNQDLLSLAADIAKVAGRAKFADHVEQKAFDATKPKEDSDTEELLKELPSKIELLMKEHKVQSEEVNDDHLSGDIESK